MIPTPETIRTGVVAFLKYYGESLNRRVDVENRLAMAATGKLPPPDAEECRKLAAKLGVPTNIEEFRGLCALIDGAGTTAILLSLGLTPGGENKNTAAEQAAEGL